MSVKIAIGADHRGAALKEYLITSLTHHNNELLSWFDVGCDNTIYCDYPEYAVLVANKLLSGEADRGVLLCGTGVGMAVTANRFPGIYAALVWNSEIAKLSREHDKSNVLVLPADYVTHQQAYDMINGWLSAEFQEGKYQHRIDLIDSL